MQMKRLSIFFLLGVYVCMLFAQQTQWKWAKQYGSSDYENLLDIATDRDGNVYGVGYLHQTGATTNSIVFGATTLSTGGGKDGFVAKWDSIGNLKWIKQVKNAEDASVNRVVCDSTGNVFIAGSFLGTIDVGGVSLNATYSNAFWAKLNSSNGTAVWTKKLNLSTSSSAYVTIDALCLDKTGNLYVGGTFENELKVTNNLSINSAGLKDGFVAQSSSTGAINWVRSYNGGAGDVDNQSVFDLVTDNKGSLYVGGDFFNYIDIGGTTHYNLDNTPFVAKMNIATGANTWFQFGSNATTGFSSLNNTLTSLSLDSAGNVYACGNFGRDITWGTTTLNNKDNTHYYGDFYVVKFSNTGAISWAKSWGGAAYDEYAYDIYANKDGSFYLVGDYGSTTDFGNGAVAPVGGQGYSSAYLAKYTENGNLTWLRTVGNTTDPENGYFYCAASDRFGNIFVGSVVQSSTFHYDNTVNSSNASSGSSDIGIARLRDKTITITSIESQQFPFHFQLYPNPCTNQFSLEWEDVGKLTIFNTLGETVKNQDIFSGKNEIYLSPNLPKGLYFLQIETKKNRLNTTIILQ